MKSEFLRNFPHMYLTAIGLFLFLIVFVAIVLRTYSKKNEGLYAELASLPNDLKTNELEKGNQNV